MMKIFLYQIMTGSPIRISSRLQLGAKNLTGDINVEDTVLLLHECPRFSLSHIFAHSFNSPHGPEFGEDLPICSIHSHAHRWLPDLCLQP